MHLTNNQNPSPGRTQSSQLESLPQATHVDTCPDAQQLRQSFFVVKTGELNLSTCLK